MSAPNKIQMRTDFKLRNVCGIYSELMTGDDLNRDLNKFTNWLCKQSTANEQTNYFFVNSDCVHLEEIKVKRTLCPIKTTGVWCDKKHVFKMNNSVYKFERINENMYNLLGFLFFFLKYIYFNGFFF